MLDIQDPRPAPPSPFGTNSGNDRIPRTSMKPLHRGDDLAALEELDFGVILVRAPDASISFCNAAARLALGARHPLRIEDERLHSTDPRDASRLRDALIDASDRGLRRLMALGDTAARATVAVVPIPRASERGAMVMLSRRTAANPLAIESYGRCYGLTGAETRVLRGLCSGNSPQEIAAESGLGISTIRSQITSIRLKTATASLRALVADVASLPPFVSVLHRIMASSAPAP